MILGRPTARVGAEPEGGCDYEALAAVLAPLVPHVQNIATALDRGVRQADGQAAAKEAEKADEKGTYASISKEDERVLDTCAEPAHCPSMCRAAKRAKKLGRLSAGRRKPASP